jgi:UTP-glucose-1-phosphate uridylyltransferase/mevalonate kinase
MEIFVPGRICLFGEHSDWAGGYRRINADIEKGYTLIAGTNQGLHANVRQHASKLIVRCAMSDGTQREPFEVPFTREALLEQAQAGGFYSYAAGAAYQVLTHYRVRGIEIDNYETDLPAKKGLSSSAAICVLVVRAFNRLYDLKMTVRGEMEFAYLGEITTPSRCGRMDQGCAYGNRPTMMVFDGDRLDVRELSVPKEIYFVIVDLCASKNTQEILSRLNQSYPFAETPEQRKVHDYLGRINTEIVHQALEALTQGDAEALGALMVRAQKEFDANLQPACPSQLTAPVLHKTLNYEPIQPLILGGKGVGSQGDGTAQFLVKDAESQRKVIEIIERDLKMPCLELVIRPGRRVRKAIIPAAGLGTRMFPATRCVKKEFFPIIDRHGRAKPVIQVIVEEALSAGIEEVGIVIQSDDRALFEEFFYAQPTIEHFNKLSAAAQEDCKHLLDIGHRVKLIPQDTQEGFGHAVYCTREWVADEPFLLLLGDHLYATDTSRSCAQQLIDVYERVGQSTVGLKVTPVSEIHNFGCAGGSWREPNELLTITEFAEKPHLDYAQERLRVDGLDEDQYLTVFGQYVLDPKVFDYLQEHIDHDVRERGEFQLTSCLERLRQELGCLGYIVQGKRFDIGLPDAYRQTLIDYYDA